ncbi:hypothetical protein [Histidinibacterium aquaticum]|uniref:Phasin family protein n=1 Tax=Histidinibacterium aquaticum TaxID=2613962 RepID=A0A5J5GG52_9RHOB|nr:hypothetical protein [Histidinibacterium aquaticum]KAA9006693.1 hypothetical protein F3S47_12980 [Histidinibacterium aquaticum]
MRSARHSGGGRPATPMALGYGLDPWQLVGIVAKAQACGVRQAFRMTEAYIQFLNKRLEQDRALVGELASGDDTLSVLAAFYRTASSDYAEEARHLTEICAEAASETAGELQEEMHRTIAMTANGARHPAGTGKTEAV